jgi:hypothetical protein
MRIKVHPMIASFFYPLCWLSEKLHCSGLSDASRGLGKGYSRAVRDVDSDPLITDPELQSTEVGLLINYEKRWIVRCG